MADDTTKDVLDQTGQQRLRSIIEQVEASNARKAEEMEHCKQVLATAKADGYDPKAIKAVVKLRSLDPAKRQEFDAIVDLYCHAAGV